MKIRNIIAGLLLIGTMVGGVGLSLSSQVNKDKIQEADAAIWRENPTIYFMPSDKWCEYNASFKMNAFDNFRSGKQPDTFVMGTKMTNTYNGRDIYKFSITDNKWISHIQFIRMDSTGTSQWDYSEVFETSNGQATDREGYDLGVNLVMMDAGHSWADAWVIGTTDSSGNTVSWVNTADFIYKSSECSTPSSSTTRIFVYNSGTHWASGGKTCVRAWGGSATKTLWSDGGTPATANSIYNLSWFQDDNGTYYGYCDIPLNATGFQLAEFTAENDTSAVQVTASYNSQDLWFSNTDGFSDCVIYCPAEGNTVSAGKAHDKVCGATLLTKVLEAIDTCSDNDYNGYNAAGRLNYHFYNDGETQIATSAAQSATVTTLGGSSAMACSDIMTAILARDNANSNQVNYLGGLSLFNNNGNTTIIVVIVVTSVIALSAIGGYFFLRRKEN